MTTQCSDAIAHAMLDIIESTIGTLPPVQFRTGVPPANTAATATGTNPVTVTLASNWANNAASRQKTLIGTPSATATSAGLLGHYRMLDTGGTCHLQGLVAEPWAVSKAYLLNQQVTTGTAPTARTYRCTTAGTSASSGTGPSGTTTGITDGTAVWAYVGDTDFVVDNTNIANGQQLTILSYTLISATT